MLGKKMYKVGLVVMVVLFMATSVLPVNLLVGTAKAATFAATFNVMNYGAAGNGTTLDTTAIQSAIDAANSAGGGEVYFPAGTYKTVALALKSNVTLNLASGSKILASPVSADWTNCSQKALVSGTNITYAGIIGTGELNDSQASYYDAGGQQLQIPRPNSIVVFKGCSNITVSGVTLKDSVNWTTYIDNCDTVTVDGIIVRNAPYNVAANCDGIDINKSRNVIIRNCNIETGDDGICLKNIDFTTPSNKIDMYNIQVLNCTVASTCNATKIGTETIGNIYNVTFDGITINRHSSPNTSRNNIAGISIQSNDGASVHDITFKNYTMNMVDTPIFVVLNNRQTKLPGAPVGSVYNITFDTINTIKSYKANQINTCSGAMIGKVTFTNIYNHNYETYNGTTSPAYPAGEYPEPTNYGSMPAYGLFARNDSNLIFAGNVNFYNNGNSSRPEIALENVTFTKDGVTTTPSPTPPPPTAAPIVVDNNSTGITYAGTWTHSTDSNYYNSTKSVSNTTGSTATMSFNGTEINIYTKKASALGKYDVYIDGVLDATVDTYNSTDQYKVKTYSKSGLSYGQHTVQVKLNGQKNASSSDYYIGLDYFEVIKPYIDVDDASASLTYVGTWTHSSDYNYYYGTKSVSNTTANTATLTFTGTEINIYTKKASGLGKYDVYIDGVLDSTVDTYSSTDQYKVKTYSKTGLSNGQHTVQVKLNGQKNASSTGYYIGLDLLQYR